MAVDDIALLRGDLPDLFDPTRVIPEWNNEYVVVPISNADRGKLEEFEVNFAEFFNPNADVEFGANADGSFGTILTPTFRLPVIYRGGSTAPGAPVSPVGSAVPPDALAFYAPYHYFDDDTWGIYLTVEGVHALAAWLWPRLGVTLTWSDVWLVARQFLYAHEAFHHCVECFATRLEVDRRIPLFKGGFETLFQDEMAKGRSREEALASAYAIRRIADSWRRGMSTDVELIVDALVKFVKTTPPAYQGAEHLISDEPYEAARDDFSEDSRHACFSKEKKLAPRLWQNFSHAYHPTATVRSRVNYLVPRAMLRGRMHLNVRFLERRFVVKQLRELAGMEFVREGSSHEIWRLPGGNVQIPRHRVLSKGVVSSLLRRSGTDLSISEFLAK